MLQLSKMRNTLLLTTLPPIVFFLLGCNGVQENSTIQIKTISKETQQNAIPVIPSEVNAYLQSEEELNIKTDGRIHISGWSKEAKKSYEKNLGSRVDFFNTRCKLLTDGKLCYGNLSDIMRIYIGSTMFFPSKEECRKIYSHIDGSLNNFNRVYELLKMEYVQYSFLDFNPDDCNLFQLFAPSAPNLNAGLPALWEISFENATDTGINSQESLKELAELFKDYRGVKTGQHTIEVH